MSWGNLFANGLLVVRSLWTGKKVQNRKRVGRRQRFQRLLVESLEGRDLLAADFLYSLEARPGVPDEGFGFAVAANDQFHVVSNFAPNLTYYFLEEQPDLESFFYGEIQVHDATTGELLRTIQNPFPYGRGDFGYYSDELNFALERPNSFGYSIDIFENLILVGSPGWEGDFDIPPEQGDHDTGGRAFLFDAETGDLLHTFDGSYFPQAPGGQPGQSPGGLNNDGFGRSVSIDGNRIAIGAHGPSYEDVEKTIHDIDPGRVYIYSATTGNLLHLLESPDPSPVETLDFGATVSLSDGKLVVTQGDLFFTEWESGYGFGPTRVYDVQTGDLLHTLPINGFEAVIEGNNIVIGEIPGTTHFANATTGGITQTISAQLYDFDGNLLVTGNSGFVNLPFQIAIRDFPSGDVLYPVPQPPGYANAVWAFNGARVFEDRLLIPSRHGLAAENFVLVYSVTNGPENGPPTDIALTNNSVPENSANGTVVGTLSATDPDSPETFTFALANSAGGRFEIVGNQLRVNDGNLLNFEANTSHDITVEVFDSAGNSYSEGFTIQITNANDAPTNISLSPNTVAENSPDGTIVGTLSAADIDPTETFTYTLLTTLGGRFALNGDQIVVGNGSLINYEAAASHNLTVQVTDSAGNTFSEGVLILVTNVNEPPTSIGISNDQVLENTLGGAVGLLTSNDPDNPDAQSFELLDNAGGRFGLSGSIITVANGGLLDYETNTSHTISVRVTDSVGHQFTGQVTINVLNVNESPTDIGLSNSNVAESTLRVVHSQSLEGTAFGGEVAAAGDYILASEQFGTALPIEKRVQVIHATNGEQLRTLTAPFLNPTAGVPDGRFGDTFTIVGNLAYIGASHTKVGNLEEAGAVYVFDVTSGNLLFTLNSPTPTASGFFGGTLAVSGNLLAVSASNEATGTIYLFNANTGQLLETVPNPTPAPLEAFGQSLALSGNTLVASSRFDDFSAADAGRAYIYQFNPATSNIALLHTLNNPTPEASEFFGGQVAVNGNIVAVKDSTAVGGATNVGSVHLFDRVSGSFLRTLENPTPGTTDQFGAELVVSGDLVIASSASDIGGSNNGRAYVFRASTGVLLATIENPSPNGGDEFGFQLAVTGNRFVTSARGDDTDGQQRGLVYVFDLPFGQPVGTLSATDPDAGETFTYAVTNNAEGRFAIDGNQLVIADATKLNFEAATSHYVTVQVTDSSGNTLSKPITITVTPENEPPQDITLNGNAITESQLRYFHNPAPAASAFFAYGVEVSGNMMLVGTNTLQASGVAGKAHVFNRTTGALVTTLTSPSSEIGDLFGERVALSGNLAVVGARLTGEPNTGRVYVYNATTGALLHTLNPDPADTLAIGGQFGLSVAIDGNLIVIGSERNAPGMSQAGAVYLFDATTGNLLQTILSPSPAAGAGFGYSVSVSQNRIAIGAPSDDTGADGSGRAYSYAWNPQTNTASLVATLSNPSPAEADQFGFDVQMHGTAVLVSARLDDTLGTNVGQVYLFDATNGALLNTLNNPTPAANDIFGVGIAITENSIIVSSQFDDTTANDSGSVYVFDRLTGQLQTTLANPSPNGGDFFGVFVAADDEGIIVGSTTDDTDGSNFGMVYQYTLSNLTSGLLSTSDPDSGDSHNYTLVNDADGRFKIIGNQIVAVDPSRFDFEVATSHQITIKSTDSSGLSTYEAFIIQVTNVNEPPTNIDFVGNSVAENATNGTVVSTLNATDPDAGSTITYSLGNNAGGRFDIAGNTIVVANGTLLDFETTATHTVTVRATDNGGKFVLETLKINVLDVSEGFDYGDLPNSFGTLLASDGARHATGSGLRLGATVTGEANGQPAANANLDAGDDGATLPFFLIPGLNATLTVSASQVGRLDAFIDYDGNGSFSAAERITPNGGLVLTAGVNNFTISIPATAAAGSLGARFRISSLGGLGPTGLAADGEVEDYRVNMATIALNSVNLLPDPEAPGSTLMLVNGTQGADDIVIAPFNGQLRAKINNANKTPLAPLTVSRIVIFGLNGNDHIRINNTAIPGYIDGGAGKDTIRGGNGPDTLLGGIGNDSLFGRAGDDLIFGGDGNDDLYSDAGLGYLFGEAGNDDLYGNGVLVGGIGNDRLFANGARNLLIGGDGKDRLYGASGNQGDLFVAMGTVYDTNLAALRAIHNEWKKAAPVLTRIGNLNGSTTGGLNGPYFVTANNLIADTQNDTIFNDGSNSILLNDWIVKSSNDTKPSPKGIVVTI
jgi:VCBS repeat-containing protein